MLEEAYLHLVRAAHRRTGSTNLCLAGGVALNAVANGRIRPETPFEGVYVQPAAATPGPPSAPRTTSGTRSSGSRGRS